MLLMPDVNVLLPAFRADDPRHSPARGWLERALTADTVALTPAVATAVVRVLTHVRAYRPPDTTDDALAHVSALRAHPAVVELGPGPRHWEIFSDLCRTADTRGNLVADAAHAAVAIEHAATWVTFDRDFARFPGLRWRVPAV